MNTLNEQDIRTIKTYLKTLQISPSDLALLFDVDISEIQEICNIRC
jgi:hypothetical protein